MSERHPESANAVHEVGYDRSPITLKGIVWFVVIFVVFGVAAHILMWFVYTHYDRNREEQNVSQSALMSQNVITPPPRLQPSPGDDATPAKDMADLRARELAEFKRRGWLDEKTATVVIPDTIAQQVIQMSAQQKGQTP
jgi:hypothetical protein